MSSRHCPHGKFSVLECDICTPQSSCEKCDGLVAENVAKSWVIRQLAQEKEKLLSAAKNMINEIVTEHLHGGKNYTERFFGAVDMLRKAILETEMLP